MTATSSTPRLRIAVAGASGRMGRMLVEAIQNSKDCMLSAALDLPGSPALGSAPSKQTTARKTSAGAPPRSSSRMVGSWRAGSGDAKGWHPSPLPGCTPPPYTTRPVSVPPYSGTPNCAMQERRRRGSHVASRASS